MSGDGRVIPWPTRGRRQLLRDINRNLVLNVIKARGAVSRADVARELGLSPATVTAVARGLLQVGLLAERRARSQGGRPPVLLSLRPDAAFVVGVKVAEKSLTAALTDLEATPRARHSVSLRGRTPVAVVEAVADAVRALSRSARIPRERVMGIGVGLAGIVDGVAGVCRYSPFFDWRDVPLRDLLANRLGLPAYVDNDVNTLAIAEKWFGAGRDVDHFLTVTTGRGVGLGIVLHGHLYRGATGAAGEFGHTIVEPEGSRCQCGKRGCLEALVAEPALVREYAHRAQRPVTAPMLYKRAAEGDPVARAVLAEAGERFGRALANLVNVLNPQRIVLSGEGAAAGEALVGPLRESLRENAFANLAETVELVVVVTGDDEWARGAASLVLGEVFRPPVYAPAEHPARPFLADRAVGAGAAAKEVTR